MKYVPHLLYVVRKEKMYEKEIAELQRIIDESSRIVFFGGAGVSTESGIPDSEVQTESIIRNTSTLLSRLSVIVSL